MKKQFIRIILLFIGCQILIFVLSLIIHKEMNLLHYIDYSFYIGSLFIFTALLLHVVKKGFFDIITKSFRMIFAGKKIPKQEIEKMQPLSKIVTFDYSLLMFSGLLVTGTMLLALYVYLA